MKSLHSILSFALFLKGFLIYNETYDQLNENNKYVNNYRTNSSLCFLTDQLYSDFIWKHIPLNMKISATNLTSIFLLCIDFISEANLYAINAILNSKSNKKNKLNVKEICKAEKKMNLCGLNRTIRKKNFFEGKQKNFYDVKNKGKRKEIVFSKIDIFKKVDEIHFYVFTNDFINNLDPIKIQQFMNYVANFNFLKKINKRCINLFCQNQLIKMSIAEYFILGIWSFLKEVDETTLGSGFQITTNHDCY
ncbi:hypothetical protein NCER_100716 [Vairimorpha ceranae BRL01]|uniref:Uncharacterized protein n=2 Tax=Vairimorpha ceranae TaxID=40302 RepID=C4V8A5_VAIC1|nr:hypothetical protein AAJ76_200017287 [Vairimorpha ceranae]EEQ82540.1 hypothetical protein NCER_100716 [Vairimorpha ceranae BRL01]KAF5141271.1 hypothetical protein G9O61_00g005880 [Vairimorpha ceranae]KKO76502.1 hypothetical protein AAJ76_200017287 [Vairimorpha ceranae]